MFIRGLLLALASLISTHVAAQYRDKPPRLIVPCPPRGGNDIVGPLIANELTRRPGQQMVIEQSPICDRVCARDW